MPFFRVIRKILFCAPCDAALVQVVYRNLDGHLITGQNSDIVHTKLTGNMRLDDMSVGQLHFEVCVGHCFYHNTFKFNNIVLRQNNPSLLVCNCLHKTCN